MSRVKYRKDRYIKIFRIVRKKLPNAKAPTVIKQYIHAKNELLHAYIRQMSAMEVYNTLHKETSAYLVVINYHPEVDTECYVEFTAPDDYELRQIETKLVCQIVSEELGYTKVLGKELK